MSHIVLHATFRKGVPARAVLVDHAGVANTSKAKRARLQPKLFFHPAASSSASFLQPVHAPKPELGSWRKRTARTRKLCFQPPRVVGDEKNFHSLFASIASTTPDDRLLDVQIGARCRHLNLLIRERPPTSFKILQGIPLAPLCRQNGEDYHSAVMSALTPATLVDAHRRRAVTAWEHQDR